MVVASATGTVFNIQRYSIDDGPGIRTTVFFKGCPLSCVWCSNPESQNLAPELMHRDSLCKRCYRCVAACPKKLFSLVESGKYYAVRCKSLEMGKNVMQVCSVGCIACHKCEKSCSKGAIKIVNNLAVIDYNICSNVGECFKVCPTRAIAIKENGVWNNAK